MWGSATRLGFRWAVYTPARGLHSAPTDANGTRGWPHHAPWQEVAVWGCESRGSHAAELRRPGRFSAVASSEQQSRGGGPRPVGGEEARPRFPRGHPAWAPKAKETGRGRARSPQRPVPSVLGRTSSAGAELRALGWAIARRTCHGGSPRTPRAHAPRPGWRISQL